MSEQITASVGLSLTPFQRKEVDIVYFTPVIEFPQDKRNSAPIYLPEIVFAQDQDLPKEIEDEVWKQHDKDDPLAGNNGGDDPLKLGDTVHVNSTIPIKLANDQGKSAEFETIEEMKLVRYGSQVMQVFGPSKNLRLSTKNGWSSNVYDDIQEKVVVFATLNQSEADQSGNTNAQSGDASGDYQSRQNFYDPPLHTNGNFNQQKEIDKIANACCYLMKIWWAGRWWRKTFVIPGNRNDANKQINDLGRKAKLIRETLHFSGSTEQSIKYWYDNPEVAIVSFTFFMDEDGNEMDIPEYIGEGKFSYKPNPYRKKLSPVWGTIIVEYIASYSEYLILYDYPNMNRPCELLPGSIEKVGYITVNTKDKPIPEKKGEPKRQGYSLRDGGVGFQKVKDEDIEGYVIKDRRGQGLPNTLVEGDLGYDRIELDKDWIRNNKSKSDYDKSNCPQVALKLLKKLRWKPVTVKPIEVFYTNGKRAVSATFSPPPPTILDMPEKELPKMAIFEKRLREKTAAGGWNINAVEVRFMDIYGNITQEKLEMGWKTDWKNNPSKGVGP